jgi:5-methylcytosine-specific restriction enzyme A
MPVKAQRLKAKNHKCSERMRGNAHQRGYDRQWARFRLEFLGRNPLCLHCKREGIIAPANQVDHIVPHRGDKNLFWDQSNMQPLCHSCHSRKTKAGQ